MRTPEEKYNNDPQYRQMVQVFEGLIAKADFTPSELREMVMFSCIRREIRQPLPRMVVELDQEPALSTQLQVERSFADRLHLDLITGGSALIRLTPNGSAELIKPEEYYKH